MTLEDKIKNEIRNRGHITVDNFMEIALFDKDGGYYIKKNPIGINSDFITSPEISVLFGEILGAFIVKQIQDNLQRYDRINLIELGAGKGTLLNDILNLISKFPDIYQKINCYILDINPILVENQRKILINHINIVNWINSLQEIGGPSPHIYIANEFFDALPVKQFLKTDSGIRERVVMLDKGEKLVFSAIATLPPKIIVSDSEDHEEGAIMEYSPLSVQFMQEISENLLKHKGFAVIIDYGYSGFITGDSLQSVAKHGFNDIFNNIGDADITAHVNFRMLYNVALNAGLESLYLYNQSEFLKSMGIIQRAEILAKKMDEKQKIDLFMRVNRLVNLHEMGELFKFMIAEKF